MTTRVRIAGFIVTLALALQPALASAVSIQFDDLTDTVSVTTSGTWATGPTITPNPRSAEAIAVIGSFPQLNAPTFSHAQAFLLDRPGVVSDMVDLDISTPRCTASGCVTVVEVNFTSDRDPDGIFGAGGQLGIPENGTSQSLRWWDTKNHVEVFLPADLRITVSSDRPKPVPEASVLGLLVVGAGLVLLPGICGRAAAPFAA